MRDRFLSVVIDLPNGPVHWLILELMDSQWFLYTLGADKKIIDALPFASDIQALQHAGIAFDVARAAWIEDPIQ